MIGVVLGNGASKSFYDGTGDLVIGCNFPGKQFSVDATIVCDEEIVFILRNNPTSITCPMIISDKVYAKMQEFDIAGNYSILSVFKHREWYSAGHYAAEYLIQLGCSRIDIWGCDSIFLDTIESSTDSVVEKDDKVGVRFYKNWRRLWSEMFDANPSIIFSVMKYQ
jgi:hypothetical protein